LSILDAKMVVSGGKGERKKIRRTTYSASSMPINGIHVNARNEPSSSRRRRQQKGPKDSRIVPQRGGSTSNCGLPSKTAEQRLGGEKKAARRTCGRSKRTCIRGGGRAAGGPIAN